jgi:hypothetical protein
VDAIGDHTIDLGRWSYRSQALVVIRQSQSLPMVYPATLPPGPSPVPPKQGTQTAGQPDAPKGHDEVVPDSHPRAANNAGRGPSYPENWSLLDSQQLRALRIWLAIAAFAALFLLGLTNKVVIFCNMPDLLLTFVVFLYPFVAVVFVASLIPKDQSHNVVYQAAAVLAALGFIMLVVRVFYSSIKANGIWIGVVVAIFKLVSSVLLGFLAILGLNAWWKRDSLAYAILGLFSAWALHRFINEEAVREQRHFRSVALEAAV